MRERQTPKPVSMATSVRHPSDILVRLMTGNAALLWSCTVCVCVCFAVPVRILSRFTSGIRRDFASMSHGAEILRRSYAA